MASSTYKELNREREETLRESVDKPQADATHYTHSYDTKERLASYWHQVDETLRLKPRNVLEIGTGTGFTCRALRNEGVVVHTLDIAADLNPSLLGSVRALPFPDNAVDVAICCQVLEHLPLAEFEGAVRELYRVAAKGVVISLPDRERYVRFSIAAWNRFRYYFWEIPRRASRRPYALDPQHYWEIGQGEVGRADIARAIKNATGQSARTYRVFENPYHRFFILEK